MFLQHLICWTTVLAGKKRSALRTHVPASPENYKMSQLVSSSQQINRPGAANALPIDNCSHMIGLPAAVAWLSVPDITFEAHSVAVPQMMTALSAHPHHRQSAQQPGAALRR